MTEIPFDDQLVISLVEAQPQPVFYMAPVRNSLGAVVDFQYRYCNEEMYRYSGLSREQLIGRTIFNSMAVPEDLKQRIFEQILEVYSNNSRIEETLYNPKLNHYYRFLRSKVNDGVLTVLQDRDEEYKGMLQIRKQQTLLDNILQFTSTGISVAEVIRDDSGNISDAQIIIANEAAAKFTGLSREDYLNRTLKEVDPHILDHTLYEKTVQTLATGLPFHTQYYLSAADRWLELSVSRMDADHLIIVFADITQTKKAEIEIKKQSEQLNSIINTSKAGMFTLIPVRNENSEITDFRFGIVNQSVASYIGETAERLKGSLASIYFPAYKENGLFEIYRDTFEQDKIHHFDFHYEDGYDVFFNIHTVKTGEEVLVTFTDQTTLKRLQRELEASIQELKRSNSNLEEFAYAASHDLKEPIRKIHFFSDRLRDELKDKLTENEAGLFERMQNASERMGLLIDDLLVYSQASMRPRHFEEVDLEQLVKAILVDLELEIEQKNAVLKIDPLPRVQGHLRQLQQLFHNLLSNALKYNRSGVQPEISVECRKISRREVGVSMPSEEQNREFYRILVADNGIGFEQKDAERIFNIFQRLHGNSEYKGTGVGLAIARKVAENHDGFLTAESEPGKGARFTVILPA